jgi:penicillin-binding protein 1C
MGNYGALSKTNPRLVIKGGMTLFIILLTWFVFLPKPDYETRINVSPVVTDKNGVVLRAFISTDGRRRMALPQDKVDPLYLKMLLNFEDKRFYWHMGFDPFSLTRAVFKSGGASTLTMQTARLLSSTNTKTIAGKLSQIHQAIILERHYSKREILELYMLLAPFGGNLEGVRAASFVYFNKEPARLSPSEAAFLVAVPQSPENRSRLLDARNRVLKRANEENILTKAELDKALETPLPMNKHAFPVYAAHYSERLMRANPHDAIKTTLDFRLQSTLEALVKEHITPLERGATAALIVIDNATGELRAHIGGADYFNIEKAGAMDLTRAIRSPGSALKPFIYGLAFDLGLAHPETLLEDRPSRYGAWAPENFDHGFTGTVSARTALQFSLNLPAVELLGKVGTTRFLSVMKGAGLMPYLPKSEEPNGLAIALGGLGVTLHDLTHAYAKIARGGEGMLSPVASWYLADILRNAPPPVNAPSGVLAYKTGTSYGYRDAWAIGFDKKHTIGVWVGRADNASVNGLVGRLIAAPLLFDAFKRVGLDPTPFPTPTAALLAKNNALPPPLKGAIEGEAFKLLFPADGVNLEIEGDENIPIKITGGFAPYHYLIDDKPLEQTARRVMQWSPEATGFMRLSVIDATGKSVSAMVRVVRR